MVKLEISRIRRQVDIGDNLEEGGISHDVAVSVARRTAPLSSSDAETFVSRSVDPPSKLSRFTMFRAVMVSVFIMINVLNLSAIPLRHTHPWMQQVLSHSLSGANCSAEDALSSVTSTPLERMIPEDWETNETIILTNAPSGSRVSDSTSGSTQETAVFIGSPIVEGFLESLEDPILSKWIAVFLALSVVFNGYLFRAATTRPVPRRLVAAPIDRRSLVKAENFTSANSETEAPLRPEHLTKAALDSAKDAEEMDSLSTAGIQDTSLKPTPTRGPEHVEQMLKSARAHELSDEEVGSLALSGKLPSHALEKTVRDYTRAVKIRRSVISR
ncbi:3-hydroxy-3-methylglutaryl-coenzyme A (HMG-CoA) reductase isozyme, partial [Elasticomyces elasticus]